MSRKSFVTRSFRITAASLAITLLYQGMLLAQMSTPAAPVGTAQASKALASEEITEGVQVDVLELKRTSGGSVTLKFAITNGTAADWNFLSLTPFSKISLLDLPNKKKYLTMTDSAGACVCSGADHATIKRGTRETFWAKFQAPPEQVKRITVQMPSMPPFEDVAITQ